MNYVEKFEKLGFGLFVHFGLYSVLGKGEWYLTANPKPDKENYLSSPKSSAFARTGRKSS